MNEINLQECVLTPGIANAVKTIMGQPLLPEEHAYVVDDDITILIKKDFQYDGRAKNLVRVGHVSKNIQINLKNWEKATKEERLFQLLWGLCMAIREREVGYFIKGIECDMITYRTAKKYFPQELTVKNVVEVLASTIQDGNDQFINQRITNLLLHT